uniref:Sushi domain-containing protein n=1 Tax=Strigamia maritima TaxID=126957 RepID=T1J596_STRMM
MAQLKLNVLHLLIILHIVSHHTYNTLENTCEKNWERLKSETRSCGNSCAKSQCKNPRAKCVCDGPCGYVCVPPDLRCNDVLTNPEHGKVDIPNGNKFHKLAHYTCEKEFELIGPSKRICQSSSKWSGPQPFCTPKGVRCAPPEFEFRHAYMLYSSKKDEYYLGDNITFTCDLGYVNLRTDILTSKCVKKEDIAVWTPIKLTCRPISCRKPEQIENGYYKGNNVILGSEISYHCDKGYYLVGFTTRICLADRVWSSFPPTCEIVECLEPPTIKNGGVQFTSLSYLSYIQYSCNSGYVLEGPSYRQCDDLGEFTEYEPKCVEIDCGQPEVPKNGTIHHLEGTKWNQRVHYLCDRYTISHGATVATCKFENQVAQWSPEPPICIEHCAVPHVNNANFKYLTHKVQPGFYIAHFIDIEMNCDSGYEIANRISNTAITSRCLNGKWNDHIECAPARCFIDDLNMSYLSARHWSTHEIPRISNSGDNINLQCDFNYPEVDKTGFLNCSYGVWQLPEYDIKCRKKSCDVSHVHFEHGLIFYNDSQISDKRKLGKIHHDEYLDLSCFKTNYELYIDSRLVLFDAPHVFCKDGALVNNHFECLPGRCKCSGLKKKFRGKGIKATACDTRSTINDGKTVILQCLQGYSNRTQRTAKCNNTVWQIDSDARCKKKCDCSALQLHNSVQLKNPCKNDVRSNTSLALSCASNFTQYVGNTEAYCNEGTWIVTGYCYASCSKPIIPNSFILDTKRWIPKWNSYMIIHLAKIEIKCRNGYHFENNKNLLVNLQCINGQYDKIIPKCIKDLMKETTTGKITTVDEEKLSSNIEIEDFSYGTTDSPDQTTDNTLSYEKASCSKPIIPNSFILETKRWIPQSNSYIINHLDEIEIKCRNGYHFENNENLLVNLQCINGQYDKIIPKCIKDLMEETTTEKITTVDEDKLSSNMVIEDFIYKTTDSPDLLSYEKDTNTFPYDKDYNPLPYKEESIFPVKTTIVEDITTEVPSILPSTLTQEDYYPYKEEFFALPHEENQTIFPVKTTIAKDITSEVPTNLTAEIDASILASPLIPKNFYPHWFDSEIWTKLFIFRHLTNNTNFPDKRDHDTFPYIGKNSSVFKMTVIKNITEQISTKIKRKYEDRKCTYEPKDKNLLAFLNGNQLDDTQPINISYKEVITFRCYDIRTFLLIGSKSVKCTYNKWKGRIPTCKKLQLRSVENAPVITYETEEKEEFVDNNGTLHISHDSKLSLKCWWFQVNGDPTWDWNGQKINFENAEQSEYSF